jgi:hypothetical protein
MDTYIYLATSKASSDLKETNAGDDTKSFKQTFILSGREKILATLIKLLNLIQ